MSLPFSDKESGDEPLLNLKVCWNPFVIIEMFKLSIEHGYIGMFLNQ
jgi:hypothetical protein